MPDLVINAIVNPSYGSVEITNKYAPLTNIILDNTDRDNAIKVINKRMTALTGRFPKKLLFYASWPHVDATIPAVIVISSNRAEWIAKQFAEEDDNPNDRLTGYLDNRTLHRNMYLWYSPRRSGRRVFISVHITEYEYYTEKLGNIANVTVVGWKADAHTPQRTKYGPQHPPEDVVGFGASRMAALELAKKLDFHRAWVVDDNVVNINGFPNLLNTVEAKMANDIWGIGFTGASILTSTDQLFTEVTFEAKDDGFDPTKSGLLQQVVLWNIDLLRTDNRTMSPCFLMSNEDTSFSAWMATNKHRHPVIAPFKIVKVVTSPDAYNKGAGHVEQRRMRMLSLFDAYEKGLKINYKSKDNVFKNDVLLPTFIQEEVLTLQSARGQDPAVVLSRCVEQVMSKALEKWPAPVGLLNPYYQFIPEDRSEQRRR
jgi:hypothetical protein